MQTVQLFQLINAADDVIIEGVEVEEFEQESNQYTLTTYADAVYVFTDQEVALSEDGEAGATDETGELCLLTFKVTRPIQLEDLR